MRADKLCSKYLSNISRDQGNEFPLNDDDGDIENTWKTISSPFFYANKGKEIPEQVVIKNGSSGEVGCMSTGESGETASGGGFQRGEIGETSSDGDKLTDDNGEKALRKTDLGGDSLNTENLSEEDDRTPLLPQKP